MTQTLNVLIVTHTARLGGAELALLRLCDNMLSHFRVSVITFEDGELVDRLRRLGIRTDVLQPSGHWVTGDRGTTGNLAGVAQLTLGAVRHAARLAWHIRAQQPHVVMSWTLKSHLVTTLAYPFYPQPLVWYLHDRVTSDYLGRLNLAILAPLSRVPNIVLANSWATAQTVSRTCVVAYPGLTPDQFAPPGELTVPSSADSPELLMLGRISPTKGQKQAILAFSTLRHSFPTARLRIVGAALFGEERYEQECRDLATRLGLSDAIDFAGQSPDPRADLDRATVLVHASPVPEPFGQVIAEAMARRVPVVATDAGGVRELLLPRGQALGRLVTPGSHSALAEALADVLSRPLHAAVQADRAYIAARELFAIRRSVQVITSVWQSAACNRAPSLTSRLIRCDPRKDSADLVALLRDAVPRSTARAGWLSLGFRISTKGVREAWRVYVRLRHRAGGEWLGPAPLRSSAPWRPAKLPPRRFR